MPLRRAGPAALILLNTLQAHESACFAVAPQSRAVHAGARMRRACACSPPPLPRPPPADAANREEQCWQAAYKRGSAPPNLPAPTAPLSVRVLQSGAALLVGCLVRRSCMHARAAACRRLPPPAACALTRVCGAAEQQWPCAPSCPPTVPTQRRASAA